MEALGRLFDIALGVAPVDLAGGASTGLRVHLRDADAVSIVYVADAGTAGEDVDLDIQEHNASTGGTSQDLDVVTHFYSKREVTLDNDEQWVKTTQTAASEVDLGDDEGESQVLAVVTIQSEALSDGFEWVSCNVTDSGTTTGKLGTVLYLLHDLKVERDPTALAAPL